MTEAAGPNPATPAPAPAPGTSHRAPAGDATTRLHGRTVVIGFAVVLGVILLLAAIGAILGDAPEPPPECAPGTECGGPPAGVVVSTATPEPTEAVPATPAAIAPGTVGIRAGATWKSADLGFEFEYSDAWAIDTSDGHRADLVYQGNSDALLIVAGVPAAEASPEAYADRWFDLIKGQAPDLRVDASDKNAILGPSIGFVSGIGRTYAGTWTTPQAATIPIGVGVVTASDGQTTAAVVLIVWNPDSTNGSTWRQYQVRGQAELILKTFRWTPGS